MAMRLSDEEKAMRDGARGPAVAKAMDLLIRYGEALGAEDFVYTDNVAGVPGSSPQWVKDYYAADGGDYRAVFSRFDLDSDEVVDVPRVNGFACHLQGGMDPELWREQGMSEEAFANFRADEQEVSAHGIQVLKTCTPYLAGNVPVMGEHCAWMESSAVIYCNAVLGARTNTEGRESTGAASITGRIPYFGLHIPENRLATHLIDVQVPVAKVDATIEADGNRHDEDEDLEERRHAVEDEHAVERGQRRARRHRIAPDENAGDRERGDRKPVRHVALRRFDEEIDQQDDARRAEQEQLRQDRREVVDVEFHHVFRPWPSRGSARSSARRRPSA